MKKGRLLGVAFCVVFLTTSWAQAAFHVEFENPGADKEASGVSLVSGWVFSDLQGNPPVTVRLFIDGVDTEPIPCCGARPDVQARVAGAPANTGFGLLRNFGRLSPGQHIIGVQFSANGEMPLLVNHTVTIVKPGGITGENPETFFSFLNTLDPGDANVAVDSNNGEIIVAPVTVQDRNPPDGSGLTRKSTLRLRWEQGTQSFETVSAASDTSFEAVQTIFTNHCALSGCHDSATHAQNQDLSAGHAFQSIVAIKSTEDPSLFRVNPGEDEDESLLYRKITGENLPPPGTRMPLGCSGNTCLSDQDIQTIENWIIGGAAPPQ